MSFTLQVFTLHSNRVKSEKQIFALGGIRTHNLIHLQQDHVVLPLDHVGLTVENEQCEELFCKTNKNSSN